jgi:hypothetical protein
VASAKDPQPAQVVHVLELTASLATDSVVLHGLAAEGRGAGVLDAVGNIEPPKPVADPVGITGPDENLDTRLHDSGESIKEGPSI